MKIFQLHICEHQLIFIIFLNFFWGATIFAKVSKLQKNEIQEHISQKSKNFKKAQEELNIAKKHAQAKKLASTRAKKRKQKEVKQEVLKKQSEKQIAAQELKEAADEKIQPMQSQLQPEPMQPQSQPMQSMQSQTMKISQKPGISSKAMKLGSRARVGMRTRVMGAAGEIPVSWGKEGAMCFNVETKNSCIEIILNYLRNLSLGSDAWEFIETIVNLNFIAFGAMSKEALSNSAIVRLQKFFQSKGGVFSNITFSDLNAYVKTLDSNNLEYLAVTSVGELEANSVKEKFFQDKILEWGKANYPRFNNVIKSYGEWYKEWRKSTDSETLTVDELKSILEVQDKAILAEIANNPFSKDLTARIAQDVVRYGVTRYEISDNVFLFFKSNSIDQYFDETFKTNPFAKNPDQWYKNAVEKAIKLSPSGQPKGFPDELLSNFFKDRTGQAFLQNMSCDGCRLPSDFYQRVGGVFKKYDGYPGTEDIGSVPNSRLKNLGNLTSEEKRALINAITDNNADFLARFAFKSPQDAVNAQFIDALKSGSALDYGTIVGKAQKMGYAEGEVKSIIDERIAAINKTGAAIDELLGINSGSVSEYFLKSKKGLTIEEAKSLVMGDFPESTIGKMYFSSPGLNFSEKLSGLVANKFESLMKIYTWYDPQRSTDGFFEWCFNNIKNNEIALIDKKRFAFLKQQRIFSDNFDINDTQLPAKMKSALNLDFNKLGIKQADMIEFLLNEYKFSGATEFMKEFSKYGYSITLEAEKAISSVGDILGVSNDNKILGQYFKSLSGEFNSSNLTESHVAQTFFRTLQEADQLKLIQGAAERSFANLPKIYSWMSTGNNTADFLNWGRAKKLKGFADVSVDDSFFMAQKGNIPRNFDPVKDLDKLQAAAEGDFVKLGISWEDTLTYKFPVFGEKPISINSIPTGEEVKDLLTKFGYKGNALPSYSHYFNYLRSQGVTFLDSTPAQKAAIDGYLERCAAIGTCGAADADLSRVVQGKALKYGVTGSSTQDEKWVTDSAKDIIGRFTARDNFSIDVIKGKLKDEYGFTQEQADLAQEYIANQVGLAQNFRNFNVAWNQASTEGKTIAQLVEQYPQFKDVQTMLERDDFKVVQPGLVENWKIEEGLLEKIRSRSASLSSEILERDVMAGEEALEEGIAVRLLGFLFG